MGVYVPRTETTYGSAAKAINAHANISRLVVNMILAYQEGGKKIGQNDTIGEIPSRIPKHVFTKHS